MTLCKFSTILVLLECLTCWSQSPPDWGLSVHGTLMLRLSVTRIPTVLRLSRNISLLIFISYSIVRSGLGTSLVDCPCSIISYLCSIYGVKISCKILISNIRLKILGPQYYWTTLIWTHLFPPQKRPHLSRFLTPTMSLPLRPAVPGKISISAVQSIMMPSSRRSWRLSMTAWRE